MNITETDKTKMRALFNIAAEQLQYLESMTLALGDNFNIEPIVPFLINDRWPMAVDPLLIADPNSDEDKISRAYGIMSILIGEPIKENFLDFGCGEGHVVDVAKGANKAVGYDVVAQGWDRFNLQDKRKIFTTNWKDVEKNGPYETILIYDVLDHMIDGDEVVGQLIKVASVLATKGKIYVRCHPWCSRHGTHLYQSINRAYLHLCLDEPSLDKLGYKYMKTIKLIHPLATYEKWFDLSGFTMKKTNVISEKVEPFFFQSAIAALIKRNWKTSHDEGLASGKNFPDFQMGLQFVDYVLEKKLAT